MRRPRKVLLFTSAAVALVGAVSACGTQRISVPSSDHALHEGAVLFHERCAGCHTLSYAATQGSAAFVRTKEFNNGPNFNIRCERPMTRVLYAIENGGFSGAIMPQNIVVGQQAIDVAKFVATYAGRQAPQVPGIVPCTKLSVGSIPAATTSTSSTTTTATTATTPTTTTATTASSTSRKANKSKAVHKVGHHRKAGHH